jgi:hypothetical protein
LFFLNFGSFVYFLYFHFLLQEKIMTGDEFAQMPNCSLAESIHNKWLQASGNKGGDLYVAIVDHYIRALFQVVVYHQFLKGGIGGDGPSKEFEVDDNLWHIAHVPYNFSNACWAMHAVTKKKCIVKIVSNSKSTPAPAYLGVWNYYKFTTPKAEKSFFLPRQH